MDIADLRKQIDEVDENLIRLFSQRMDIAAGIARYKEAHKLPVFVPEREKEVLTSVYKRSRADLAQHTRALYLMLFELSKSYQKKYISRSPSADEAIQSLSLDENIIITMILPCDDDTLFKLMAKQNIYGIKVIRLSMEPLAESRMTITLEIGHNYASEDLSAFLSDLRMMSESFNISSPTSEVMT